MRYIMKKIAIIPARSGSKGLKNKNIIDICGKPLIAYSIEAAVESKCFDRIIVSTDSEEYGNIARRFGSEVMYRDDLLSNDKATTYMVLKDLLNRIDNPVDYFVLLQPTSPMRTSSHIRAAIDKFEKNYDKFDFLVSVKEAKLDSTLIKPIDDDESMKFFDADFTNYRRQNSKEYCPNGAIFIGKPKEYIENKHFFGKKSLSYIMNDFDSIDIDDELDYEFACLCMKKKLQKKY